MNLTLAFAALSLFPAIADAQTVLRNIPGTAGQLYGTCVIRGGDQNGDGFEDLIVGAPGQNAGQGAVFCLSGSYLALGIAPIHLWSLTNVGAQGDEFGASIALAGDLTGNSAVDFVVGAPGRNGGAGAVYVVDGASRAVVSEKSGGSPTSSYRRAGTAVANVGDLTGDGIPEIAIGMPESGSGFVAVVSGANMWVSGSIGPIAISGLSFAGFPSFGASLATSDFNGDGRLELIVGAPREINGLVSEAGAIRVFEFLNQNPLAIYRGGFPGEHFGAALDAANDYDGDGVIDVIVGAPDYTVNATQYGRAAVLSGAHLLANLAPAELYQFAGGGGTTHGSGWHCGASVRASADLNNDGFGDILIGMPGFDAGFPAKGGRVQVVSGKTGADLCVLDGSANQRLGGGILGAAADYTGDGFPEFVVAGPSSSVGGTDAGVIRSYRLFPIGTLAYCTGKINSQGCTPFIFGVGTASTSSTLTFDLTCGNAINNKVGLLIYSQKPGAAVFQGGFLCIEGPIKRVGQQSSGGNTGSPDCSGTFIYDFNARIDSGLDAGLTTGRQLFCQYWSRDPSGSFGSSLSNALQFLINP